MKKTKLTRSLMAAVSVVALSAVMYGCVHSGDDPVAEPPPPPIDSDGDGVSDADDAFPMDPDETADADGDGVGDNADLDDDNDGVADDRDDLPNNAMETTDTDGDGVGNNADADDDGDGVADAYDAFPLDAMETVDSDGDGVGDNADTDRDGDGVDNAMDAFPDDPMETADSDMDGTGDSADSDRDGDGVDNAMDAFPDDAMETADFDMDGMGDNADTDDDNDGVADADDAFPMDAMETADLDMDGVGDNADSDRDGDGVDNAMDAFPDDAMETADLDMDGTGDNADTDRDGDGVDNAMDAFPDDAMETADLDMDGVGDNADTDRDGDGVDNAMDAFPDDGTETVDSDMDGTGDNADTDRDGDGIANVADLFPDDPGEYQDSDGDGVGNNGDAFPFNAAETRDSDGDGVGDNADAFPMNDMETTDSDGDGVGDMADAFPNDPDESVDTNGDGVGDNAEALPRLLQLANALRVMDDPATADVNEQAAAVETISMEIGDAAVETTNGNSQAEVSVVAYGNNNSADDLSDDTGTRWPFGKDDDGDGVGDGELTVVVNIGGTQYMNVRENPDTEATENNFRMEAPLGDFMHGFDISVDADSDTAAEPNPEMRTRILVFTDKEQASKPDELRAAVQNAAVTAAQVVEADMKNGLIGAKFDHDNMADTDPLPGTFTCPEDAACTLNVDGEGNVTTITNYTFTSADYPQAHPYDVDEASSEEDLTYLAFGVWMQDDVDATDPAARYTFGAFANGGSPVDTDTYGGILVIGSAKYEGSATGVYTEGDSVDYFQGDATLTAEFGDEPETGDDDDLGTITGMIHNIVAGGNSMDDVINLNSDDMPDDGNISATGAITGNARMGEGMTVDTVTTYTYSGNWSAQFYNGTEDDTDTAVDESHAAPGSVAGTFGVTGTDDMGTTTGDNAMDDDVTRSYVGAFGAHKVPESN